MPALRPDTKVLPIPSFNILLPPCSAGLITRVLKARSKASDMARNKTAIVTGAYQGIGAELVDGFLKSGYSVVATSRRASESLRSTPDLVVVDRDIGISSSLSS